MVGVLILIEWSWANVGDSDDKTSMVWERDNGELGGGVVGGVVVVEVVNCANSDVICATLAIVVAGSFWPKVRLCSPFLWTSRAHFINLVICAVVVEVAS